MSSNPQPRPQHPGSGDWRFLPLLLIPVACCALMPLGIAGIAAALMPFNVMLVWLALAGGTGCLVTGVLLQRELRRANA